MSYHLHLPERRTDEPLPPRWVGATAVALVLLSFAWTLAYSWGSVPLAEGLGQWNYVGALGGLALGAGFLELWRTLH
jgi:hypothetical protein